MNLRNTLLAATVLLAPVAAMAQPVTGPYVSLGLGYDYHQDWKGSSTALGGLTSRGNGGPAFDASVGWGFGNGLRVELEGNYLQVHNHVGVAGGSGSMFNETYGGFGNVLYDFDIGASVFPYIGAGAGYEETSLDTFHITKGAVTTNYNTSEGGFAAQGIAGLSIPLDNMMPGLSATVEYRFIGVLSDETFHGIRMKNQYDHQGLIGVRYAFGAPPPPPAPAPTPVAAPAPAPARTYLVFFDWDKADLSARAQQIIKDAATASTRVAVTKIQVNGYTDRSGTPAYNQVLSVRRGNAVAAELVKDGVPKGEIVVQGFGETHPLVPTADGVREAQNRRVEIILQ